MPYEDHPDLAGDVQAVSIYQSASQVADLGIEYRSAGFTIDIRPSGSSEFGTLVMFIPSDAEPNSDELRQASYAATMFALGYARGAYAADPGIVIETLSPGQNVLRMFPETEH